MHKKENNKLPHYHIISMLKLLSTIWLLTNQSGHLIGCDKKSDIVQYFQGRLCNKIGLLCDKLCDFFSGLIYIVLPGFKGEKPLKCCLTGNMNVKE